MSKKGWTIQMGAVGGVLSNYVSIADLGFLDTMYDYGTACILLAGLDGLAAPTADMVVRIVWNQGLATEQIMFEGFIDSAQKGAQGDIYTLQAYTLDAYLDVSQTGDIRNCLGLSPYAIMQGAGPPANLLTNNAAAAVLTYGAAAGVPNKVDATNPGVVLTQFVADSKSLFTNMKRLCQQSQYNSIAGLVADAGSSASVLHDAALVQANDYWLGATVYMTSGPNAGLNRQVTDFDATGDILTFDSAFPFAIAAGNTYTITIYGLEWVGHLEGANNSSPRFYLVKRRERAVTYTPEVYVVPDDFYSSRRGNPTFLGLDAVKVIGAGDGVSRIESNTIGSGSRETVTEDKAILNVTNADNMANRLLGVYNKNLEFMVAHTARHNHATRAGDFITVTQAGVSKNMRVMERVYEYIERRYTFTLGRPMVFERDHSRADRTVMGTQSTSPQFTDVKPEAFEGSTNQVVVTHGANVVCLTAGHPLTVICESNGTLNDGVGGGTLVDLGKAEGFLVSVNIQQAAGTEVAHTLTYDKTNTPTQPNGAADIGGGVGAHIHDLTYTPTGVDGGITMDGPYELLGELMFADGSITEIYRAMFWYMPNGLGPFRDRRSYIFAARNAATPTDYTPTNVRLRLRNWGPRNITVAAGVTFQVVKNELHRHNAL